MSFPHPLLVSRDLDLLTNRLRASFWRSSSTPSARPLAKGFVWGLQREGGRRCSAHGRSSANTGEWIKASLWAHAVPGRPTPPSRHTHPACPPHPERRAMTKTKPQECPAGPSVCCEQAGRGGDINDRAVEWQVDLQSVTEILPGPLPRPLPLILPHKWLFRLQEKQSPPTGSAGRACRAPVNRLLRAVNRCQALFPECEDQTICPSLEGGGFRG